MRVTIDSTSDGEVMVEQEPGGKSFPAPHKLLVNEEAYLRAWSKSDASSRGASDIMHCELSNTSHFHLRFGNSRFAFDPSADINVFAR
jgi:hypothetical protein